MRKAIYIALAVGLVVCVSVFAEGLRTVRLSVNTGATAGGTDTANVRGYVEQVLFDVPTAGGSTGTVTVSYQPDISTMAAITIATKTGLTADQVVRPRVDGTTTDGTANTNDPPERYPVAGVLTFTVASARATNLTWKCEVLVNDK